MKQKEFNKKKYIEHRGRENDDMSEAYQAYEDAQEICTGHPESDDENGDFAAALDEAYRMREEAIEAGVLKIK